MKKQVLLLLMGLGILAGCGNKSTIKNGVKPVTLAERYGDGTYIYPELLLPITDIDQYNSTVPNAGPLLSGIARTFMGIGAGMGLGKMNMSLTQPLPKIPREYVKDIRLKRVFFYIEPKQGEVRRCKNRVSCFLFGKGDVDFDFLSKMAIVIKPQHTKRRNTWSPTLNADEKLSKDMEKRFEDIFKKKPDIFPEVVDPRSARELLILKYDRSRKDEYIKNDEYGAMFIFKTQDRKDIVKLRDFFRGHEIINEQIENIYILEDALMLQLKKDPIITETFKAVYNDERDKLEKYNVNFEECTPKTCLDLRLPEVSLIDIVTRENSVKLDAFMDARDVPETFRLKGFIEFKTKIKPPI